MRIFYFNDTATTEIYTLSLHDALPILVHRKKLRSHGIKFTAQRPDDERDREFLASTDNWFRPVQMEVGPDGALYIADMYREVIEHPWSLPHGIKQHIDLDRGNDQNGRASCRERV